MENWGHIEVICQQKKITQGSQLSRENYRETLNPGRSPDLRRATTGLFLRVYLPIPMAGTVALDTIFRRLQWRGRARFSLASLFSDNRIGRHLNRRY